jgi:hypothetical protein
VDELSDDEQMLGIALLVRNISIYTVECLRKNKYPGYVQVPGPYFGFIRDFWG